MNFALFIVLNGILLLRPEEMFPEIAGARIYLIVISLCILTSLSELKGFFSLESLQQSPVSVCVLAYYCSTILSLCLLGRFDEALSEFGPEFGKVIIYYCLLCSLTNSEIRYKLLLSTLLFFIFAIALIALAQRFGYVNFPNIEPVMQRETDSETGESLFLPRLVSSGIFNDPNDLCLLLGLGILVCLHLATISERTFIIRIFWIAPTILFVFALLETHSRGGLMGVLAGMAGYIYAKYGGPKALPYAAAGIVGALAAIGGRQGNIGGGGTAHERLMMWADGLTNLFNKPMFLPTGLGHGWFLKENGLVAHNSFVQTYVEQGLIGGTAFLGAFGYAAYMIERLGNNISAPVWVIQARPFALGSICGYAMGCYSITRNIVIPTYLILGLSTIVVYPRVTPLPAVFQVDRRWFARTTILGIVGLVGIKFATQLLGVAGI